MIRKRLLGDCPELADTYHHLGKVSQKEKALIFYGESVRINKSIGEKSALYKVALDMVRPKSLSKSRYPRNRDRSLNSHFISHLFPHTINRLSVQHHVHIFKLLWIVTTIACKV
jgi:hypothetical protein